MRTKIPLLNASDNGRYRYHGGIWQGRAGIARHDAVAWGYARAASDLGIDIIENCTVTNLLIEAGAIAGVETNFDSLLTYIYRLSSSSVVSKDSSMPEKAAEARLLCNKHILLSDGE